MTPIDVVVARDEIRQLAYRYAKAVDTRDIDLMVSLYSSDARFGPYGTGPEALRRLTEESLAEVDVAVLFIGNHLIEVADADHASGEVWCRAYVQDRALGPIEQMIQYRDDYVRFNDRWLFARRKHLLWYGVASATAPFDQGEANWPENQVGVGTIPFDAPTWVSFWERNAETP